MPLDSDQLQDEFNKLGLSGWYNVRQLDEYIVAIPKYSRMDKVYFHVDGLNADPNTMTMRASRSDDVHTFSGAEDLRPKLKALLMP